MHDVFVFFIFHKWSQKKKRKEKKKPTNETIFGWIKESFENLNKKVYFSSFIPKSFMVSELPSISQFSNDNFNLVLWCTSWCNSYILSVSWCHSANASIEPCSSNQTETETTTFFGAQRWRMWCLPTALKNILKGWRSALQM